MFPLPPQKKKYIIFALNTIVVINKYTYHTSTIVCDQIHVYIAFLVDILNIDFLTPGYILYIELLLQIVHTKLFKLYLYTLLCPYCTNIY